MQLARGKYIGFLNSDDQYTADAFLNLVKYINDFLIKILYLVRYKNTGEFYMAINHSRFIGAGDFILAIQQAFL